jgi:hypothetical protein
MPQNKIEVILSRRQQVGALYLAGRYQAEIGQILGVSQSQVSADLAAIRKTWLASSLRDFDAAKAEQLAKIDRVEIAYWQGWHRSLEDHIQTLAEVTHGEKPSRKRSRRREGQAGDPRFLDGVIMCIKQRCAILGLGAEADALKEASLGLASLLALAKGPQPGSSSPMAEA